MKRTSTCLAALVAMLAIAATPAGAGVVHNVEGSFDGSERPELVSGTPPVLGAFEGPLPSVAADRASGDVWVTESICGYSLFCGKGKGDVIDKFDENGVYAGVQITGAETPQKAFDFAGASFATKLGIFPGIGIDNSSAHKGSLYVSDTGHGVIDRFSESGGFECQITAKPPTARTAEEAAHECNGAAGSEVPGISSIEPTGLAVDSLGDVYVADYSNKTIDVFGPNGEFKKSVTSTELGGGLGLGAIALDSAGDLYVTNFRDDVVELEASSGNLVRILDAGDNPAGVAVDPKSDDVYVGDGRENPSTGKNERAIVEYQPSGTQLYVFGYTSFYGGALTDSGLAVGAGGRVYDAELMTTSPGVSHVNVYSTTFIVPNVTTDPATETGETTATLHGEVEPDMVHGGGNIVSCRFEYGPTEGYGQSAPCEQKPPYTAATQVSAKLEDLRPSTSYHFRVAATDSASPNVPADGEDQPVATKGQPSVDLQAADAQETFVTFKAKVDPWGYDTNCQVQYETQQSFEESKSGWAQATTVDCPTELGSGFGDVVTKFTVSGLARATTYHYRFLASNQVGLSGHPGGTFETYGIQEYSLLDLASSLGGLEVAGKWEEWQAGEPETWAGAHPYEVVSTINLSETTVFSENVDEQPPVETEASGYVGMDTKDVSAELPPGLLGNPTVLPRCTKGLLHEEACPGDTQVGMIEIWLDETPSKHNGENLPRSRQPTQKEPLFNVTPSRHVPAEFAARVQGDATASIPFHVRTGDDYGVTGESVNISTVSLVEKVRVRVWGVPAAHVHDPQRYCQVEGKKTQGCASDQPLKPLLRSPTSCAGPHTETAAADTWNEPGELVKATTEVLGVTGCNKLAFEPSFEAQPTSTTADSPTGMSVELNVPQPEGCAETAGKAECELAESDLKDATVTLPAGTTTNPSSADGLQGCSEEQVGYLSTRSAEVGRPQFTPDPPSCPDASKLGSVELETPLLEHALPGAIYLATQRDNPFGSLVAVYLTIYDAPTGVVVKLPGKVSLDPGTGQLTTTFDQNPQLPFKKLKVELFGGEERAAFTMPLTCGSYTTSAVLAPWSGNPAATPSSEPFLVSAAPGGGPCVNSEAQAPNAPGFAAGTASPVAGSYSPFVLKLSREDGSQRFSGLNVTLPPGLTGKIAGLEECPQAAIEAAQARGGEGDGAAELARPSCPAGSEVGVVHVGTGSGAPYFVTGHAYFAGPYRGAPFSLVIVTPAVAGPFDLGTVVVRAALFIDPSTAQVTVKSDPFPTILDGIPLDIRDVNVDMNRNEFVLNPTSCNTMSVIGQESSTAGQTAALSDRFQAGGCTTLPFHPSFAASASSTASRKEGASLVVKVASGLGQANIAKVHVELPKQLPSRLDTLKLACTERVFAADPASCPSGSVVGTAVAHTPILSSPLTGPAYIVSHGGAEFPDLEIVLSAEGVTIVLDGKTDIKNGITSSSFESVPDAPVSSFELSLPEGPHSILAAPTGLCSTRIVLVKKRTTVTVRRHGRMVKRRATRIVKKAVAGGLVMPTRIQGQNGAVIVQKTPTKVPGCAAAVKHKSAKSTRKRHKKRGK